MKYNKYFLKEGKDDKDEEYFKNRKLIGAEDLCQAFEQEAKERLLKYKRIFDKFDQYDDVIFKLPMNTSLRKKQLLQLTKDFFSRIDNSLYEQVSEVFSVGENADYLVSDIVFTLEDIKEKGYASCSKFHIDGDDFPLQFDLEEIKKRDPEQYTKLIKLMEPRDILFLRVTRTGSISDLYNLVHEFTHYFILKENDEQGLLAETAPHCMERLVDDFLLSLTPDECAKYGFDRQKLNEDVLLRNVITFALRYKDAKDFNKMINNNNRGADEQESLKYILALIYQSKFMDFGSKERKEKIIELINTIKSNDFNKANEVLEIEWDDETKRQEYIERPISNVIILFELYKDRIKGTKGNALELIDNER